MSSCLTRQRRPAQRRRRPASGCGYNNMEWPQGRAKARRTSRKRRGTTTATTRHQQQQRLPHPKPGGARRRRRSARTLCILILSSFVLASGSVARSLRASGACPPHSRGKKDSRAYCMTKRLIQDPDDVFMSDAAAATGTETAVSRQRVGIQQHGVAPGPGEGPANGQDNNTQWRRSEKARLQWQQAPRADSRFNQRTAATTVTPPEAR